MTRCKLAFLTFLCTLLSFSCSFNRDNSNLEEESTDINHDLIPSKVYYFDLGRSNFNKELLSNGKLEAIKKSNLKFAVEGIIKTVEVAEGQYVTKKQKIAQLYEFEKAVVLSQSQIRYKQSSLDYEDHLLRLGFRLEDSVQIPENIKKNAKIRSGLANAEIELYKARFELDGLNLLTPFAGKIANMRAKNFDRTSGLEFICSLIDDSEMIVDFPVMEQELSFLAKSKRISITPFSDPQKIYYGTILSINPSVEKTGMVNVKAIVKNNDHFLLDGMSVKVSIQQVLLNRLAVPKTAVLDRQGKKVVFIVNDNKAIWKDVEIVSENSQYYDVLSGLKEGDKVIFEGNFNLANDKKIIAKRK